MLSSEPLYVSATERDQEIFEATVRQDHYLRRVKSVIDFERLRPLLADAYCDDQGRPAIEPLLMLKLEFLQYQYTLSDREVIERSRCNMAFRYFLGLSLHSALPHPTSLTCFRQRLGAGRHQQVFDAVVGQAREQGLVKDRLRLKDATHVIANIAIPSTIALVAQTRDRLLQALESWAAESVEQHRQRAEQIRQSTADLLGPERLVQRVAHLRELVAWAKTLGEGAEFVAAPLLRQRPLQEALALACRVVDDCRESDGPDRVRSVQDPDARTAKHGEFYTGYLVDVAVDADSQIVTALNVLPGGANEGADAATLIRQEQDCHGNQVQALSMDSAGYQGALLQTLTDPAGLNLEVFVPAKESARPEEFQPEQFTMSDDEQTLTCPGGKQASYRRRVWTDTGWQFYFRRADCAACPLQSLCVPKLPQTRGRGVIKSDYEADLLAARAKTHTPEYKQVRAEHGAVERKLGELVRRHGARRARYRGRTRVLLQQLITATVVNIKRMVRLVEPGGDSEGAVRAVVAAMG